jgi:hypothetical protein
VNGAVKGRQSGRAVRSGYPALTSACLLAVLLFGPAARGAGAAGGPDSLGGARVVESRSNGLVIEFSLPGYAITSQGAGTEACELLEVDGYDNASQPGLPRLPTRTEIVGIPPEGMPVLGLIEAEQDTLAGRHRLCPGEKPVFEPSLDGETRIRGIEAIPDPEAYGRPGLLPATSVELDAPGFIRSQRVARLRFQPFQYNPVTGEVVVTRRLRVRVTMPTRPPNIGGRAAETAEILETDAFEGVLRDLLVNYEQARLWRTPPPTRPLPMAASQGPAASAQTRYTIQVDRDGIFVITYADLQKAGMPVGSVDPRQFRLMNRSSEVSIIVEGDGDGSFDPGDYLLFYGQRTDSKYSTTNAYLLDSQPGPRSRMLTADGTSGDGAVPADFQTTVHLEEDRLYLSAQPSGTDNDHWYFDALVAPSGPTETTITTTLTHLSGNAAQATVRGLLKGYAATPLHHAQVLLNAHLVEEATWPQGAEHWIEVAVPATDLIEGTNSVTVRAITDQGTTDQILLVNWFELDYGRLYQADNDILQFDGEAAGAWRYQVGGFSTDALEVYDITAPLQPLRISGASVQGAGDGYQLSFQQTIGGEHRYLALSTARRLLPVDIVKSTPEDLLSSDNAADLIIISHPDFLNIMQLLGDIRSGQGYRTKVVDVQDIYELFGGGMPEPGAIHDFLAYAYAHWAPPAPTFVLLAGDGNYDPKDNLQLHEPVFLPPYLADVDPWIGETAAENRFVTVVGDDSLPDMFLGRLPVRSQTEAKLIVNKLINYDAADGSGWNRKLLFVADNPDNGGDFHSLSDAVADHYVPPAYTIDKIYQGVSPYTIPSDTKAAIIQAINQGRLIVSYVGHASLGWWATEKLLSRTDIASLDNGDRLPFFAPMTCYDGYFIVPATATVDRSSLGEMLVRAPGKGAIASFSPAGLGIASGHDVLEKGVFTAIFQHGQNRIGVAVTQAKLYLYANSLSHRDLIDSYVLLGDPTTRLKNLYASYLPLVQRN